MWFLVDTGAGYPSYCRCSSINPLHNQLYAILGADFLGHYNLLVKVKHSALIDTLTHLQVHGLLTQEVSPSSSLPDADPQDVFATILAEFPSIVRNHSG